MADTKGGIKRGIRTIGSKNSLAFEAKVKKESIMPRTEKPKENKRIITKNGKSGGKVTFRKTEKIIIKINPVKNKNKNIESTLEIKM